MKIEWINQDFYKPEYRNGFFVSSERKKLWAIELDLLKKFVEVCTKNNLNYFLNGGTLLGAVRHTGFIPWDDDIDVMMPREDYDELVRISQKEFRFPYFFQTPLSDNNYFRSHAQLRNSLTTGCTIEDAGRKINRGIFIDIFVLDGMPNKVINKFFFKFRVKLLKKVAVLCFNYDAHQLPLYLRTTRRFLKPFFPIISYSSFYQYFQKTMGSYSFKASNEVGEFSLGFKKEGIWAKDWFDGYMDVPFEMLKVRIPVGYAQILKTQYGLNWFKMPEIPPENFHGKLIISTSIPYTKFFKK